MTQVSRLANVLAWGLFKWRAAMSTELLHSHMQKSHDIQTLISQKVKGFFKLFKFQGLFKFLELFLH